MCPESMEDRSATWSPDELFAQAGWIRALALSLVRDAAQADDLVQETLLAGLERRPTGGPTLRQWLRGVLHRRVAFWRRGHERRRARERAHAVPEALPSSAALLERAEAHRRLVEALTGLRDPYRTVLLLRFYEDLAPREIARRQGVPAATVRSQLKRGLAVLRAALDERHGGDRRAWALALVPLARAPITSLRTPPPAMYTAIKLCAGSGLFLLAGKLVLSRLEPAPPAAPSVHASVVSAGNPLPAAAPVPAAGARAPLAHVQDGDVVRGVLRERESGAPLPGFALQIGRRGDADDHELLWTDAEGCFATERRYVAGDELLVSYLDHPELVEIARNPAQNLTLSWGVGFGPVRFEPGRTLEWQASVGPTYGLALSLPSDASTSALEASLRAEGEPFGWLLRGPVRAGAPPWVRFLPTAGQLPPNRAWLLQVETEDGLWAGEARVAPGDGVYPEPVEITLSPSARLEVTLRAGETLIDPVVTLEAVAGGGRQGMLGPETLTPDDSRDAYRFTLTALPAGDYRILVRTEGFDVHESTVTLVAGEVLAREIAVVRGPSVSHLRGELQSVSGDYDEEITLWVSGPGGHQVMQMPRWEEREGRKVAPFAFDNLPAGEYELSILSWRSHFRWDGLVPLSPPRDGIVLSCRDTDPVRTLEIRVHDAGTGEPLERSCCSLQAAGCATAQITSGGSGRCSYEDVPLEAELAWWASAAGYVPRWGDASGAVVVGESLVIDVGLSPGWGARVRTLEQGTGVPLAGVELLLDGQPAGVTDENGCLDLVRSVLPGRVEPRRAGWRWASGGYDPDAGELLGPGPMYVLSFARE